MAEGPAAEHRRGTKGMNLPLVGRAATATGAPEEGRPQEPAAKPSIVDFSARYREFYPKVFAYVYGRVQDKEVSLDIVSEVFERAFSKGASLRSDEAFGAWLFTIARNAVASHWRKEKPAARPCTASPGSGSSPSIIATPNRPSWNGSRWRSLLYHVHQLSQREQEVLSLKFDAELSNQQIAQRHEHQRGQRAGNPVPGLHKLRDRMKSVPE